MATTDLTAAQFNDTVNDNDIVLVDFWASWCGPCRQFAPTFSAASDKHPDVVFAKVDTDDQQALAGRYGIRSIPTLVIYRDSIPVFSQPGSLPASVLEDLLDQVKGLDMQSVRAQYDEQLKAAGR